LGGSVVLGFLAKAKNGEAKSACGGRTVECPSETLDRADEASTLANAGTVVGTLGILGIGAGAALLFVSQPNETGVEGAARGWSVAVEPSYAGFSYAKGF
jgi:hypothetical protein